MRQKEIGRTRQNEKREHKVARGVLATGFAAMVSIAALPAWAAAPATQPDTASTQGASADNAAAAGVAPAAAGADLFSSDLDSLMNIQVTSVSKKAQSINSAPAAISVVTQDDIARSGFSTIPDLLRLVPGMDVGQANASSWGIGARGYVSPFAQYSNKLLVMEDGRTLYTPLFAGTFWDSVDYILPDLDRIEVIKGPGATLWGANAVNGVVNIDTKDAKDTQGFLLNTRGSDNGEENLGLRYGGKLDDNTYYRVWGKGRYFNEDDLADGNGAGDEWGGLKGGFRIDKHASDADTYTLEGEAGGNRLNNVTQLPTFTAPFTQAQRFSPTDANGDVLGRWNHVFSDTSDCSLQLYYDYVNENSNFNYNQSTVDVDFHDHFAVGTQNDVTWGVGYRFVNEEFAARGILVNADPTQNDNTYSTFVQDAFTIQPDHWVLTAGAKLEHNDFTGFEVEPSARLLWTPDKTNSVWAAVSRAVRTPSRLENDVSLLASRFQQPVSPTATVPAQVDVVGNPNEQSEELVAYEVGYRFQPIKQMSVDVATFYNQYNKLASNQAQPVVQANPLIINEKFGNGVQGDTYGGEISSTIEVTPQWRLSGSYSLLQSAFENVRGSTDTTTAATDASESPENQFQVHSYLDVTKNIQFNASVYYADRIYATEIPAYFSTDLNVVWKVNDDLTAQVGVQNLFDNGHSELGSTGGTSSQVPRTVYADLTYKF